MDASMKKNFALLNAASKTKTAAGKNIRLAITHLSNAFGECDEVEKLKAESHALAVKQVKESLSDMLPKVDGLMKVSVQSALEQLESVIAVLGDAKGTITEDLIDDVDVNEGGQSGEAATPEAGEAPATGEPIADEGMTTQEANTPTSDEPVVPNAEKPATAPEADKPKSKGSISKNTGSK
jgi:hypothetical protein